jgi:hypothetical protein
MSSLLLDAAGRRRAPATLPGHHCGRPPRNKGLRYPADPPTVEEIITVMRHAGNRIDGDRRALIVILWRSGLRISEALALRESDLDPGRGAILVRCGKGGKRREVGMDHWGWEQLQPWLTRRTDLPVGSLFCVIHGSPADARGRRRPSAPSSGTSQPTPACDDGRPASAASRTRRGDGPRRGAADDHPKPARAREPRRDLDLPPRHRQRRDHQHRSRLTRPDDPRPPPACAIVAERATI